MAADRTGAVTPTQPSPILPAAAEALAAARAYAGDALAPETRRAYAADWAHFTAWCQQAGCAPLPAEPAAVAAYLAALAPLYSRAALERRLAAIGQAHRLRELPWSAGHPAIRSTLRGIHRTHRRRPRQAAALTSAELRRLVAACGHDLTGLRDRALLLLGFAGALRRSELVGIAREHLRFTESGLRLLLPQSKTDQEGQGVELGITRGRRAETCPIRALEAWLEASACRFGPVFRKVDRWGNIEHRALGGDAVRDILRRRAAVAGITVPSGERLSPHGLRAGFVTEAYMAGARDEQVMDHTRHRDLKTMRGYVRRAKLVTESATKLLDL
ncbi:site-specific integrase [Siccirubricoccus sp. KC 17139]|uniref:Site-specific integrase n=1 Tax=Siccirubricoccus soli TaxID=2899147 RepID=A0ABT1D7N6_9PROT|nr:site-specific integrase [Siccirubricoccus soli]MCO6417954.1 site-specific integrase [Siccirubricoccus soli]MCP2684089.1 site-specific integrase [Siccirubricoccus soli]